MVLGFIEDLKNKLIGNGYRVVIVCFGIEVVEKVWKL